MFWRQDLTLLYNQSPFFSRAYKKKKEKERDFRFAAVFGKTLLLRWRQKRLGKNGNSNKARISEMKIIFCTNPAIFPLNICWHIPFLYTWLRLFEVWITLSTKYIYIRWTAQNILLTFIHPAPPPPSHLQIRKISLTVCQYAFLSTWAGGERESLWW